MQYELILTGILKNELRETNISKIFQAVFKSGG